jgi:chromosome segregation ATPase
MAVQNSPSAPIDVDLEATAELPAPDFESTADLASSTDVHVSPAIPAGVAELAASLREAELRLARKMERVVGLEGDLTSALRTSVELRAQLDHENTQKTRRENVLRDTEQQLARNTERVAALEVELATAQRSAAELRTQLEQETTQGAARETALRESVEAMGRQVAGLKLELASRDAAQRRLADDIAEQRRCNASLVEALQSWQGFRGVAVAQLDEQDAHLVQANARHAAQVADIESRIATLQAESGAARLAAQQREAALEASLRAAVAAREERDASLQASQQHNGKLQLQLEERDARALQVNAQHATQVADIESRIATLQAESGAARLAAQQREGELQESLRAAQAANDGQIEFLQAVQQVNGKLQSQLDEALAASARWEHDLHIAEEHIHRLEADAHANAALLGGLQQNIERLARDDTGARPILRVVQNEHSEPAERVLVRNEDGVDVVYPLGKRTTIGRTPDNDIQVDTSFISRHHAVLLASADQCLVEDLNSTNGVQVNGKPVVRQALRDGDSLIIGKTEFRYQQRA